jgi:hypothetical protein
MLAPVLTNCSSQEIVGIEARKRRTVMMTKSTIVALGIALVFGFAGAARAETVTGEVIDTFCYASMGAKGASHKQCGIDCAKKGIPVGLLEKGSDKVYVLLPSKDKEPLPAGLVDKMGSDATVTGKVLAKNGSTFLTVESFK